LNFANSQETAYAGQIREKGINSYTNHDNQCKGDLHVPEHDLPEESQSSHSNNMHEESDHNGRKAPLPEENYDTAENNNENEIISQHGHSYDTEQSFDDSCQYSASENPHNTDHYDNSQVILPEKNNDTSENDHENSLPTTSKSQESNIGEPSSIEYDQHPASNDAHEHEYVSENLNQGQNQSVLIEQSHDTPKNENEDYALPTSENNELTAIEQNKNVSEDDEEVNTAIKEIISNTDDPLPSHNDQKAFTEGDGLHDGEEFHTEQQTTNEGLSEDVNGLPLALRADSVDQDTANTKKRKKKDKRKKEREQQMKQGEQEEINQTEEERVLLGMASSIPVESVEAWRQEGNETHATKDEQNSHQRKHKKKSKKRRDNEIKENDNTFEYNGSDTADTETKSEKEERKQRKSKHRSRDTEDKHRSRDTEDKHRSRDTEDKHRSRDTEDNDQEEIDSKEKSHKHKKKKKKRKVEELTNL